MLFDFRFTTFLLLLNFTFLVGSSIENFIHSLRQQNIALEVDAFGIRRGANEPSYNGAITVLGDDKVCWALIAASHQRWSMNVQSEEYILTNVKDQLDMRRWGSSHLSRRR